AGHALRSRLRRAPQFPRASARRSGLSPTSDNQQGDDMKKHLALGALAAFGALAYAESASAHARVSPPVALAKEGQVFTLAVPTEKEGATTTSIEFTPPAGFAIDSFVPATGWKRAVQQTGSGDAAVITKVTWTGGTVPTGEDAAFSFLATANH